MSFSEPPRGMYSSRAHASCVSPGTERAVLCGLPGARRGFPYAPGYSTVGRGRACRRSAAGFKPGDRVAGRMPHASHGVMVPASLFRVPDGVSDEEASFIELGIICLQGVRKAAIRPGERVAVVGQGLIGQLAGAIGAAGRRGADRRRGGEPAADGNRACAAAPTSSSHCPTIPDAIDGIEADVVIEAVGSAPAIALAMRAARPGGRVVLLGSSRDLGPRSRLVVDGAGAGPDA